MVENHFRIVEFDDLSIEEKRGLIRNAVRLLHVVRDDDDGVLGLEFAQKFLDLKGGDRVERGGWLIKQDHIRICGERTGDAESLLLATGEAESAFLELVFHLIPKGRACE